MSTLNRFIEQQNKMYDIALTEIKNGEKESHYMWYIFPQLRGLGYSTMSYVYGIDGIDEAKAYLRHPILGVRLIEISEAILKHKEKTAEEILGEIDAVKLRSSMTLFASISPIGSVFHQVLECFFNGEMDDRTLNLIA